MTRTLAVGPRGGMLLAMAAATAMGAVSLAPPALRPEPPSINVPYERRKLKNRKKKGDSPRTILKSEAAFDPNWSPARSSTFIKMRRMVRANPELMPIPTIKAKLRHKWFQKQVAAAVLRVSVGQALQGDAEFLREVRDAR